jgi:holo-[acyl-carrier protein] synthase
VKITGVGTDIVQIARIKRANERRSTFAKRILHPNELSIYQQHAQQDHYLAKRFAAKEAFSKAVGTGIRGDIQWMDIETKNDALGKPFFQFHGTTQHYLQQVGIDESHLSLSDEQDYAIAYVILIGH